MRSLNPNAIRLLLALLTLTASAALAENWPAWRGPHGDGTSPQNGFPTHWSADSNVVWKTAIPGLGHSSPIIWNSQIFLTSALEESQERLLLCLHRDTGRLAWQRTVLRSPLEAKNKENSYASATPTTDGKRVYATFLDSEEVVVSAYDLQGNALWLTRPGKFKSQWGFSHIPVLFEDKVLVACYSKGENFVVALSQADGSLLWKTPGENASQSYSPPLVRELAGRPQMIVPGNKAVTSYDARTGKPIWTVSDLASDSVASPVYSEAADIVLSCTSWPRRVLYAIKPDGQGNVTDSKVAWSTDDGAPYVPSPIAVGDYFLTSSFKEKAITCFNAATGEILWSQPAGLHHASPVTAGGLVYFLNDDGVAHVVKAGPKLQLVARNELGEPTYASPALSDGQIFLRSFSHLYCIANPKSP